MIELALPLLSAATTALGSAVVGYRLQRRAKKIKDGIVQRVKDRRDSAEVRQELRAVYAQAKEIYGHVTGDVDKDKVVAVIASLKKKYNITTDTPPGKAAE